MIFFFFVHIPLSKEFSCEKEKEPDNNRSQTVINFQQGYVILTKCNEKVLPIFSFGPTQNFYTIIITREKLLTVEER